MPARRSQPLPAALILPVKRAFARWRSEHGRGSRIPADLWREAAGLAADHGVHPISKLLRLNYYALKERVDAVAPTTGSSAAKRQMTRRPATFVEIPMSPAPAPAPGPLEVEVESPSGWKMRVRAPAAGSLEGLDLVRMVGALGGLPA